MAEPRAIGYVRKMNAYPITGMTCANCARKVETALRQLSANVSVTFDPPRAIVPPSVSVSALNSALSSVGKYRVSEAAPKSLFSNALTAWLASYYPLLLIMGLIAVTSFAGDSWMMSFMAGFYIVFGAFKLLNVPAFAASYAKYDIIAKVFKPWAYAYPFVELALGLAFLFWIEMWPATWAALILSLIGAAGVIQSVSRKETIQCACLGNVFNLPMSSVTIVENLGMAAMAGWMLTFGM
jgi:copper chaperone CopZ